MSNDTDLSIVVVGPCVCAYVNLAEPDTKGSIPSNKYGLTILIDKDDEEELALIERACCEPFGVESFDDWEKHPFLNESLQWRDGDESNNEAFKNKWWFKASTGFAPPCYILTDQGERELIRDEDTLRREFYSGAEYLVALKASKFKGKYKNSVTLYLQEVTKIADGTPIAATQVAVDSQIKSKLAKLGIKSSGVKEATMEKASASKSRGGPKKRGGNLSALLD